MEDWMGRYRQLVAAIVQHTNIAKNNGAKNHIYKDIYLSPNEWQVLEYIVEHRNDDERMIFVSDRLGIPQSSFSKIVKSLHAADLVERYKSTDNNKNIILKPTELAITAHAYHTDYSYTQIFKPFFDSLEGFSDEELARFTDAMTLLNSRMTQGLPAEEEKSADNTPKLIKIS